VFYTLHWIKPVVSSDVKDIQYNKFNAWLYHVLLSMKLKDQQLLRIHSNQCAWFIITIYDIYPSQLHPPIYNNGCLCSLL